MKSLCSPEPGDDAQNQNQVATARPAMLVEGSGDEGPALR